MFLPKLILQLQLRNFLTIITYEVLHCGFWLNQMASREKEQHRSKVVVMTRNSCRVLIHQLKPWG
jgi:hypothetical protein